MVSGSSQTFSRFFSPPELSKSSYLPQIDGLRALAVIAVFFDHMLQIEAFRKIYWGQIGVVHFFTISGLLITMILLNNRVRAEQTNQGMSSILRGFYARRFIRIFPIYYLTVAILVIFNFEYVTDNLFWTLTHTTNLSQAFFGHNYFRAVHFWTLSVEEQFYLFFPLIVLMVRKEHLKYAILALICFSPLFRFIGTAFLETSWAMNNRATFSAFDSLCLGALYSYYLVFYETHQRSFRNLLRLCLFVGVPMFFGVQLYVLASPQSLGGLRDGDIIYRTLADLSIAMSSIVVLHLAVRNSGWAVGRFLQWEPLRYIGKISYGAYLYHNFLRLIPLEIEDPYVKFLLLSILSLGLASLSWHMLEEPLNRLKRHFPYLKKPEQASNTVVANG